MNIYYFQFESLSFKSRIKLKARFKMKFDSFSLNYNDYSRSNHYYLKACEEENKNNSKSLLEEAIKLNVKNYDARIDYIFLKNLPIEKEVLELVSLYKEIKDVLVKSSFFKNKKGVYFLHEEGKAYIRLINHIIDDYSTLNNPKEIIKYAKEALSLDFNDTLEIKKYLAFSFLSLQDFESYFKLKSKYPSSKLFLFCDCFYFILNKEYEKAFLLASSLMEFNSWIANYILYDEYKNIISIYKSEKDVPNKISEAVDFIISSFIIPRNKTLPFLFFISGKYLEDFSLSDQEIKFLSCFSYSSNFGKDLIDTNSLINLNKESTYPLFLWLINQKGSSLFSAFETLINKGIIFVSNGYYRFTYKGLRLIPYFKDKNITKKLFPKVI